VVAFSGEFARLECSWLDYCSYDCLSHFLQESMKFLYELFLDYSVFKHEADVHGDSCWRYDVIVAM
jgi:hypothetical protein